MANTPTVYAICDANCKFESMTKEQIIAAIAEATGVTVTNVDDAFITMLKEQNNGEAVRFWVGTQAEYNTLVESGNVEDGVIYLTEDGSKLAKIESAVNANAVKILEHENRLDTYGVELFDHEEKINDHEEKINDHETRIKNIANSSANASHTHDASAIKTGTLNKDRLPTIPIAKGGTNATTAKAARENLGIYCGTFEDVIENNHIILTINAASPVFVANCFEYGVLDNSTNPYNPVIVWKPFKEPVLENDAYSYWLVNGLPRIEKRESGTSKTGINVWVDHITPPTGYSSWTGLHLRFDYVYIV